MEISFQCEGLRCAASLRSGSVVAALVVSALLGACSRFVPLESDVDAQSLDAPIAEPEPDVASCTSNCDEEGAFSCVDGQPAALQRCVLVPNTSCLTWIQEPEACPDRGCQGVGICMEGACTFDAETAIECPSDSCLGTGVCVDDACEYEQGSAVVCADRCLGTGGECVNGDCVYLEGTAVDCPDHNCFGTAFCDEGDCFYEPGTEVVCEAASDPCGSNECTAFDGKCHPTNLAMGTSCDDADPCTLETTCDNQGDCKGGYPDTAGCACIEDADCLVHDDGDRCNGVHICAQLAINPTCVFDPATKVSCADNDNHCALDECDPADGICKPTPVFEGQACPGDEDACTTDETCVAGHCVGTPVVTCEAGPCETASCDPADGECVVEAIPLCCGDGLAEADEQCDGPGSPGDPLCAEDCSFLACDTRALYLANGALDIKASGPVVSTDFLTVEMFLRLESAPGDSTLLRRDYDEGTGSAVFWRLSLQAGDDPSEAQLRWTEGTSSTWVDADGPAVSFGGWHHVALVRALIAGNPTVQFWVDGVLLATAPLQPVGVDPLAPFDTLEIGSEAPGTGWTGELDELRISSVARWDADFVPTEGPYAMDASTIVLLHMDEVAPGAALDGTGHGHHAVWHGGVSSIDDDAFASSGAAAPSCEGSWCQRRALLFLPDPWSQGVVPNTAISPFPQDLTVSFFLRLDTVFGTRFLVGQDSGIAGDADWHITTKNVTNTTARLQWTEGQAGPFGYDNVISTTGVLEADVWYHVAVTRSFGDGGSGATLRWYVDGDGQGSQATPLSGAKALAPGTDLMVGAGVGGANPLHGEIDELHITSSALDVDAFPVPTVVTAHWDTVALYHFDTGRGALAFEALPAQVGSMELTGTLWTAAQPAVLELCP